LAGPHPVGRAEQVLHVVAVFVGQDVRLDERAAGGAELLL
jgi:hypothetical protein